MAPVNIRELDDLLIQVITECDHPEITGVEVWPSGSEGHTRMVVRFASGATAMIMVRQVAGVQHTPFELPEEAFA